MCHLLKKKKVCFINSLLARQRLETVVGTGAQVHQAKAHLTCANSKVAVVRLLKTCWPPHAHTLWHRCQQAVRRVGGRGGVEGAGGDTLYQVHVWNTGVGLLLKVLNSQQPTPL